MSKLDIFRNPKFWAIHLWSPHSIVLTCYPWLIMVINCKTEFVHFHTITTQRHCGKRKFSQNKDDLRDFLPLSSSVKYYYKLHFQTAGISSFMLQMLRYLIDTQTGIQTATTIISDSWSYQKSVFHGPKHGSKTKILLHFQFWSIFFRQK